MIFSQFRYSLRTLLKSPAVAMAAIATLALGIGANTALFSVVNGVLLRPMHYPDAQAVVAVTRFFPNYGNASPVTATKFDFWRKHNHSFQSMAALGYFPVGVNLIGHGDPVRITSLPVTPAFFQVLGVSPLIGRTFTESEAQPGGGHYAVLSYAAWKRFFGGDPHAIGKTITLSGGSCLVLGVMPRDFDFPQQAEIWTPLQLTFDPTDRSNNYNVIARLNPGVSIPQANADMRVVSSELRSRYGELQMPDARETASVISYHQWIVGNVRSPLLILMGAAAFVLLLACANVANLLLARSAVRQQEFAVRLALGAGVRDIAAQMLSESLLLSISGAAFGLLLAQIALPLLIGLIPAGLPLASNIGIDWRVLAFAAAAGVITGLLFGTWPVLHSLRPRVGDPLRENSFRTTGSLSSTRGRSVLVTFEIALSLVLLAGAGLLIETFQHLTNVNPGFDPRNVLTAQMSLSDQRFEKTALVAALCDRVVTRLESIPGIQQVGASNFLPLTMGGDLPFEVLGSRTSNLLKDQPDEQFRIVSQHYFDAMRIPLLAGRTFSRNDTHQAPAVIIVNRALAEKYFKRQNCVGEKILIGRVMGPAFADVPREIVGVVGDTSGVSLSDPPPPTLYEPVPQVPDSLMGFMTGAVPLNWVIRTSGQPGTMTQEVRRETLAVSAGVALSEPRPLDEVVSNSLAQQRFNMTLLSIFAAVALLLGAIGLYGVIAYSVAQRTRELGIRTALGAARSDLLLLVVGDGMRLAGFGLAIGLIATMYLSRLLQTMLFGVQPSDPLVLSSVTAILALVGLIASYVPARRASRVDPVIALRNQ